MSLFGRSGIVRLRLIGPRRLAAAGLALLFGLAGWFPAAPASRASAAPPPPGANPLIRVGLEAGAVEFRLGAVYGYQLVNLAANQVIVSGAPGQVTRFYAQAGGVGIEGVGTYPGPVALRPAAAGSPNFIRRLTTSSTLPYRGSFEVQARDGKLTLINVLPLEDYLLGVVGREMPADWPPEALKAQAVAARSYARYQIRSGKFQAQGFDVVAGVQSQVYGGASAEDPRVTAAVQATAGQVLTYQGQVAEAFFHASGGGYTENSENVWGGSPVPYLRGVPDLDQDSPHYHWTVTFTLADLQRRFAGAGYDVGLFYDLVPAGPQGVSGRWTTLALVGSRGTTVLKSSKVREVLGLKSTLFQIVRQDPRVQTVTRSFGSIDGVTVLGARGQVAAPVGALAALGGSGRRSTGGNASRVVVARRDVPASLVLDGRGWGHGVGLSQWGARSMALKGNTYLQILGYYYRGTAIAQGSVPGGS